MKICGPWHLAGEFTGTQESGIAIDFERNGAIQISLLLPLDGDRDLVRHIHICDDMDPPAGMTMLEPQWTFGGTSHPTLSLVATERINPFTKELALAWSVCKVSKRKGKRAAAAAAVAEAWSHSDFWLRDGFLLMLVELC